MRLRLWGAIRLLTERRRVRAAIRLAIPSVLTVLLACGGDDESAAGSSLLSLPAGALSATLGSPPEATPYVVDTAPTRGGSLAGRVTFDGPLPADTLTRPTHDAAICRPVPAAPIRGSADGVGEVVVWLVGVASGPPDRASRRTTLTLSGCELTPRVQRVPASATLIVRSEDAMDARLRFLDVGVTSDGTEAAGTRAPRALVPLETEGALVPLTDILNRPGLLEVRDDRHPWIRGWIAVAPHPFVDVTGSDGTFAFSRVPPGNYVLVAWHERLGARALPVLVETGVQTRLTVTLGER